MQRTVSLSGRDYELIFGALSSFSMFIESLPFSSCDDKKMHKEEVDNLIKRMKHEADNVSGGVYIDGVRQ